MSAQLMKTLNAHWPNLLGGNKNEEFWRHEWVKHGSSSKAILDQHHYFSHQAVKNFGTLRLNATLLSAGI